MAKQTYTVGQILTAAQMTTLQANDYNQTVSAKVASYTLVASDAGTRITMSDPAATTITVNTALFAAGDTLTITNIGAGVCTITAGTATVSTGGSLALAQYDSGTLYFTSTGVSIWNGVNPGDITGVTAGTGISGGGTSGTVTVSIDTAVTVDKTTAQTLTNKTLTTPIISSISNTGTLTLPTSTDTLVGRATTDTLTNKTLTSPALTTPTISTLTTNGDLLYGTGSGALARLGIGTTGQVVTVASGLPSWATPASGSTFVGARAKATTTQTISNNTSATVLFNTETYDTDNFHSNVTNTSRMTIPSGKAGYYFIHGLLCYPDNATGAREICFMVNGSTVTPSSTIAATNATSSAMPQLTMIYNLAVGDYVEITTLQYSGGNLSLNQYGTSTLTVYFLGA